MLHYFSTITETDLYGKAKEDLSDFYWGATDMTPTLDASAKVIFERLLGDLLTKASGEWPIVRQIENPATNHENIETYHDFRKRIRTVLKVLKYFPDLLPNLAKEDKAVLEKMTSEYGDISDLIAKLESYEGKESKKESIKKLIATTAQKWKEVQLWETEQNIPQMLQRAIEAAGLEATGL